LSSRRTPYEYQRVTDGLSLLLTGAETDLGRMIFTLLIADEWPLVHIHLLYERRSEGASAADRFASFCRTSRLTEVLRERLGPTPDEALKARVTVYDAAPARDDLGLGRDGIAALKASVGAVIIAARSKRPDSDPQIALDRDLRHPLLIQKNFPAAALLFVSDVDAVSDAGLEPGTTIGEKEPNRNFDPLVEIARLAQLACHGPRRGDSDAIRDRRATAFARARLLGFPTVGGYARALAEALWLRATRDASPAARHAILRLGHLAPAEMAPYAGWSRDPGVLDAIASLVALPVRHLPVASETALQLVPVDRAAHDVLFSLASLITHEAPRIIHAVPSPAYDLTIGRALSLLQLALRATPSGSSARGLFRRWVVATADPLAATADIEKARRVAGRVGGALQGGLVPRGILPPTVDALVRAGSHWLAAAGEGLDAELRESFKVAAVWLPERQIAFSNERLHSLSVAAGARDGVIRETANPESVWRDYFRTALSPRLVARAVGRPRPQASADSASPARQTIEIAKHLGLQLLSRFRQS